MSKAISQEKEVSQKYRASPKRRQAIDFKKENQPAQTDNPPPAIEFLEEAPKMPLLLSLAGCFLVAGLCWFVIFQIFKPLKQAATLINASESRIIAMRKTFLEGKPARHPPLAPRKTSAAIPRLVSAEGGMTVSVEEARRVEALMDAALRHAARMIAAGPGPVLIKAGAGPLQARTH